MSVCYIGIAKKCSSPANEFLSGWLQTFEKKNKNNSRTFQEHSKNFQEHNFRKIIAFQIIIYTFF